MSLPAGRLRDSRNHLLSAIFEDEERASSAALLGGGRDLSYEGLASAVTRGGMEIDDRFAPGSRLLVAAYDQMVVALAFLAALRSRCVPLLVDPQSPAGLLRIAQRWTVAGAVGERSLLEGVTEVIDAASVLGWTSGREEVRAAPSVHVDEAAFWTFTSGTTGEPRAVVHAHRGPRAAYDAFARNVLALDSRDRTVSTAGLPFVYTLGNNLLFPLLAGGSAILPADLLLPTVLGELRRHRATVLVSGPWSLEAMARLASRRDRGEALADLRLVLSAGEPLGEGVFTRWRDAFGQSPIDNLGCTEMFNSFLAPMPSEARAGLLGRVVPGFDVRVGAAAPAPGRRGALAVRGESRAIGLSADLGGDRIESPAGEWCETGDEVELDGEGRFVFLGRLDDRFKVRGQFVRPAEVERRLLRVPGVSECVVGLGTDDHGVACVTIRLVVAEGHTPAEVTRAIRAVARIALPNASRTLRLDPVDSLPRSPRGKLLRERDVV